MKERYRATLIGTALGDTLGMPVETWKPEQIKRYTFKRYGIEGIKEPIEPQDLYQVLVDSLGDTIKEDEFGKLRRWGRENKKGSFTDDTILTLAIAEAIVKARGLDLNTVAQMHVKEYQERLQPDGKVLGGFGRTTTEAIRALMKGATPLESAVNPGNGNGPAMKISPVALYMHASRAYNRGLDFAEIVSKMTHTDPRSVASGVVQSQAVYSLLSNIPKQEFINECLLVSDKWEKPLTGDEVKAADGSFTERLAWIKNNPNANLDEAYQRLGGGFEAFTSVPHAYFMINRFWDEPLEGLLKLVNYGGDSDTTGAIYGAMAGARHGLSFIPRDWIEVIDQKDRLMMAADGIFEIKGK